MYFVGELLSEQLLCAQPLIRLAAGQIDLDSSIFEANPDHIISNVKVGQLVGAIDRPRC